MILDEISTVGLKIEIKGLSIVKFFEPCCCNWVHGKNKECQLRVYNWVEIKRSIQVLRIINKCV